VTKIKMYVDILAKIIKAAPHPRIILKGNTLCDVKALRNTLYQNKHYCMQGCLRQITIFYFSISIFDIFQYRNSLFQLSVHIIFAMIVVSKLV
jgi:hypothetical protein